MLVLCLFSQHSLGTIMLLKPSNGAIISTLPKNFCDLLILSLGMEGPMQWQDTVQKILREIS